MFCAPAVCPATHSRHRRACPCIVAARRVGKMRTRWLRHSRSRRAASLSAGRDGEATHLGQSYTKHLRLHYPTWLSWSWLRFLFLTLFFFLVACFSAELLGSMTNEGPCLSDFNGSQLQCVTRGHCSAGTPISGTVGHASVQQCVKETLKTLARLAHATNSDASHGTPYCSLCPEVGQGPSAPAGLSAEKDRDGEDPSVQHSSHETRCFFGSTSR